MKKFKDISIKTKLVLLITLIMFCLSIFISWFFPDQMKKEIYRQLEDKVHNVSFITGYSLTSAIMFDDVASAYQIIEGVVQDEQARFLVVSDNEGKTFTSINEDMVKTYFKTNHFSHGSHISSDGKLFMHFMPIELDGEKLGTLTLGYSMENANATVNNFKLIIRLISFVVFLFSIVGAYLIGLIITSPLGRLSRGLKTRDIGKESVYLKIHSTDEVGQLSMSFNEMMKKIDSAQMELKKINKELDKKVEDRTAELEETMKELTKDRDGLKVFYEAALNQEEEIMRLQDIIEDMGGSYE